MYRSRARPVDAEALADQPMRPVYIGGCLAWFHPAQLHSGSMAVVLCPALGREARWAYRSLRHFAVRLAAARPADGPVRIPGHRRFGRPAGRA